MTVATIISAAETLRQARALIEDPAHWCRGQYAKTDGGYATEPTSPIAERWCAYGAVYEVAGVDIYDEKSTTQAEIYLNRAAHRLYGPDATPARVNDRRGHAAVLKMYAEAIRLAELAEAAS